MRGVSAIRGRRRPGALLSTAVLVSVCLPMSSPLKAEPLPQQAAPQQEIAQLAARPDLRRAFEWFRGHEPELEKWQLELVKIPAPPFEEGERAAWIADRFRRAGLEGVQIDKEGNVLGIRPGSNPDRGLVALTAHIDTVFPRDAQAEIGRDQNRLLGPGVSDNAAGVVGMLAMLEALKAGGIRHQAPILFVGNVGEEGEGDLRGMRYLFQESAYKDRIAYTLVLDGAATDTVVTEGLGSRRFQIVVRGPGGHSWTDFGAPNPIVILARAITEAAQIELPAQPKTSLNVGVIEGGKSVNSIPESALIRVDIRSADSRQIERVEEELRLTVERSVAEANRQARDLRHKVTSEITLIGSRPAAELDRDARILKVIRAVDDHLDNRATERRASTDANVPLALGREAISIGAGGMGGGAHSLHEWYDPTNRDLGLKRVLLALVSLAGVE